jgi:hypothetical protein
MSFSSRRGLSTAIVAGTLTFSFFSRIIFEAFIPGLVFSNVQILIFAIAGLYSASIIFFLGHAKRHEGLEGRGTPLVLLLGCILSYMSFSNGFVVALAVAGTSLMWILYDWKKKVALSSVHKAAA